MIQVGKVAREIRDSLGLTQQEMAASLGITNVHLSNIENDKAFPSQQLLERYREQFDIDLYVMAWCRDGDVEKLPQAIRDSAARLTRAFEGRVAAAIERRRKRAQ